MCTGPAAPFPDWWGLHPGTAAGLLTLVARRRDSTIGGGPCPTALLLSHSYGTRQGLSPPSTSPGGYLRLARLMGTPQKVVEAAS